MNVKAVGVLVFFSVVQLSAALAGVWWWWIISIVFGGYVLYAITD